MENIKLLGIKVSYGTMEEFHREVSRLIALDRQSFILPANVNGFNMAWRFPWFAEFYNRADVVFVDGSGVVLGARVLGYRLPPRLRMVDVGWSAASYFAEQGHSLYLLGNPPGVAALAAARLKLAAPGLKIVGTHHGFFEKEGPENDAVIEEINRVRPDVLMVGLGMPLEQRWILDNCARVDARIFWNVGGGIQVWAGVFPRCPQWMQEYCLEWLFRLAYEPRRLAHRYLWGNTVFLLKVLEERFRLTKSSRLP